MRPLIDTVPPVTPSSPDPNATLQGMPPPPLRDDAGTALAARGEPPTSSDNRCGLNWQQLYERLGDEEQRQRARALRHEAEQAALADHERWSALALGAVMAALKEAADRRAEELRASTGRELEVEYPCGPVVVSQSGDCEIGFMRLSLGRACVHIYSSRRRGCSPHIHLLPAFADSVKKNHRLISEPGAFLVRSGADGYELRCRPGNAGERLSDPTSVDALLYKALGLLARVEDHVIPPSW